MKLQSLPALGLQPGRLRRSWDRVRAVKGGLQKNSKFDLARQHLNECYPTGIPPGLTDKMIARQITDQTEVQVSERTVRRARNS